MDLAIALNVADVASIPSPSESEWQIGPIPIRAYALCLIAGIVAAGWIMEARLRSRGAPKWTVLDIAVWAVPFGIIGGRLYHVVTSPEAYFGAGGDPWQAFAVWEGGLGIPGAIAMGAVGAWIACKQINLPLSIAADALAPGLPVGQAIGRLGNWFNQELYGKPTELAVGLEIDYAHRVPGYKEFATFHPTFLYELLWNLGVALTVWMADKKYKFGFGRAFAVYVALYGVGRFWIEGLRIDPAGAFLGMRTNQWMSVLIVMAALIFLIRTSAERLVLVADSDDKLHPVTWNSDAAKAGFFGPSKDSDSEDGGDTETESGSDRKSDKQPGSDNESDDADDESDNVDESSDSGDPDEVSDSDADDADGASGDDADSSKN